MRTLIHEAGKRYLNAGAAALYLAVAYVAAIPYFLLVVDYPSVVDPAEKVALLAEHYGSMYAMHFFTYVVFGIALAVVALGLHERLKDGAPVIVRAATVVALIWASVLVASGTVFNYGMGTVVDIQAADPSRAALVWQSIEAVSEGLGGAGGEILGGLWVLIVSWVALRTGRLPKALGWLGMLVGVAGIVSVVPALRGAAVGFGLLQIVWFAWLGVVMLRSTKTQVGAAAAATRAPALEVAAGPVH